MGVSLAMLRRRARALTAAALALGISAAPAVLVAGAALLPARPAAADGPTIINAQTIGLRLTPDYLTVEAYYNGSSFSGGGLIKAYLIIRVFYSDGSTQDIQQDVSDEVTWESSDDSGVYLGEQSYAITPDGLDINSQTVGYIGTAVVTAHYDDFSADATVVVWAD